MNALAYRSIGRYWRSKHRKSTTSLKLVSDTPLRELTVTLTQVCFAQTARHSQTELNIGLYSK